ncbi:MAG TPA: IPTL-CTERM sorting domain-containing protein [Bacteroidales bacterium]|nr:IPTL-CTERM sorting domain-containing protein [Bacteroidales bacterium]
MKKHFLLKAFLVLSLALAVSAGSYGQLLNENFDYVTGTQLLTNGWLLTNSTTNPLMVTAGSLSYAGYPSSGIGNGVNMVSSGQDANRTFTPQTTGPVYVGFLVNVSASQATGDYFLHFLQGGSTTILKGRVWIKKDPSSSAFAFGLSKQLTTVAGVVYTPYSYALNTTYLLVMKYQLNSGTADDVVSLYINPPTAAAEPAAPALICSDIATPTDPVNLGAIGLRQGTASAAPTLRIDGIRVGTTWAEIVGAVPVPTLSEWGLILLGLALVGMGTVHILRRKA